MSLRGCWSLLKRTSCRDMMIAAFRELSHMMLPRIVKASLLALLSKDHVRHRLRSYACLTDRRGCRRQKHLCRLSPIQHCTAAK